MSLSDVLAPLDEGTFLAQHFDRGQFAYVQGLPGKFSSIMSWDALNEALTIASAVRPESINLRKSGMTVDPKFYSFSIENQNMERRVRADAVAAFVRDGATLVFNRADDIHVPLGILARRIEHQVKRRVRANIYFASSDIAGGALHYDDHDVLILQISGTKRWQVYRPTVAFPIHNPTPDTQHPSGKPDWEGILDNGDLLFIPRGWWHLPEPLGEPTIHITLGFENRTGVNLIHHLARQMESVEFMREGIPHGQSEQLTYLRRFSETLALHSSDSTVLTSFFRNTPQHSSFALPYGVDLGDFSAPSASTIIRTTVSSAPVFQYVDDSEWVDLIHFGRAYRYHRHLVPLLTYLYESSPVAVSLFWNRFSQEYSAEQLSELLRDLSVHGIVDLSPTQKQDIDPNLRSAG